MSSYIFKEYVTFFKQLDFQVNESTIYLSSKTHVAKRLFGPSVDSGLSPTITHSKSKYEIKILSCFVSMRVFLIQQSSFDQKSKRPFWKAIFVIGAGSWSRSFESRPSFGLCCWTFEEGRPLSPFTRCLHFFLSTSSALHYFGMQGQLFGGPWHLISLTLGATWPWPGNSKVA